MQKPTQTIYSIQYLRGLSAIAVICAHLNLQMERMGYPEYWPGFLAIGVDIFFIISGYIIWTSTKGATAEPKDYFYRRALRIIPFYWIITSFYVAIALIAPQLFQSAKFDGIHVLTSYLFFPYPSPADGQIFPLVVPGWTLNFEMFFYIVFGVCLMLRQEWRIPALTAGLLALPLINALVPNDSVALQFWGQSLMFEFLIGIAIARYIHLIKATAARGLALIVIGLTILVFFYTTTEDDEVHRMITLALPAVFIVLGALLIERSGRLPYWPLLTRIGDSGYALYLSHGVTLSAMGQFWRRLDLGTNFLSLTAFCISSVVLCVLVGFFCHYYIDQPIQDYLRKRQKKRKAAN